MDSIYSASLINILGFVVGIALYALLFVMVLRHRRKDAKVDLLLLMTAVLGLLWNTGELLSFVWRDFVVSSVSPIFVAISYSALGFLPSLVVHSAEDETKKSRILTISAYSLSVLATFLHFQSVFTYNSTPSSLALQILTFGSIALLAGLLFFNYKQKMENKTVWITALLVFALSALHLSSKNESSNFFVELFAHQSSLPLVLAILIQDYRFAFADLFLKRALSLLLLTVTAFALYIFVAQPLSTLHISHNENDALATGVLLTLWIITALVYPFLHKLSILLVDKILLKRINYEELQIDILREVNNIENVDDVLDFVTQGIGSTLTAKRAVWNEVYEMTKESSLPTVDFTKEKTEVFVPTNESPFYKIHLKNLVGGRRLLSEEVAMLEAVSLLTARRIDALRVVHERCEQEIREQEHTKLTTEAQLKALRSQINPHFLFNALTTIGYLIQTAPETAFQTLMKLTQLLRSVLKLDKEFCTLGEELNLIENYLDIEKARFEERLQIEIKISEDLKTLRVPFLILQPLVENAVKHGISENKNGGTVRITAKLENKEAEVFLKLIVFDTGAGKNTSESANSNGVGLQNIKGRLKSYYGKKASLNFEQNAFEGSVASVELPVNIQTI